MANTGSTQLDLFTQKSALGCIHGKPLLAECLECDKFVEEAIERYEQRDKTEA